jgi:hypothetical protein
LGINRNGCASIICIGCVLYCGITLSTTAASKANGLCNIGGAETSDLLR